MRLAKIKKTYLVAAAALAVGAMICLPRFASAAVTGICSDCHTMHNSQNGSPMTFNGSSTPNSELVRGNCLVCHTATTANGGNIGTNEIPYVYSDISVTYGSAGNTLAGGNFYWVVNSSDADGHNVDMLTGHAVDGNLTYPPGFGGGSSGWNSKVSAQTDMENSGNLTCAGVAGCHGDRSATNNFSAVHGAHHANDSTIDGLTVGTSYRFLDGIYGTEENTSSYKWEYHADSTHHNEYYGVARSANSDTAAHSISHLCAECHGDFHDNGSGNANAGVKLTSSGWGSPWIRHPTDFDMDTEGTSTEYASYNYLNGNVYNPNVPLGHSTLTNTTSDDTAYAYNGSKGAIVMCISCHRAHGSPYADLLRWNYSGMIAGGGTGSAPGTGCFMCHTTKDGH